MTDICLMPAHVLRQKLITKAISATELLAAFEGRIQQHNPSINALVTVDFERAYLVANALDKHLAKHGQAMGPLHGLPLAVKDVFHVKGMRTTYGSPYYRDHISRDDDVVVARELAAGAVIVGKSNTPDCAAGGITTNPVFGLTRNPFNLAKTTSGSGGGGAASIAAGLVSLADGSDVGGSTRTPAAWCNCVGFRPSSGRIPGRAGSIADGGVSTPGVFTRSVLDVCLFMQAVDGPNPQSPIVYPFPNTRFDLSLAQQLPVGKVGWVQHFAGIDWPLDISRRMQDAQAAITDLGLIVEPVDLGLGDAFRKLYADVNCVAVVQGLPERVRQAHQQGKPVSPAIAASIARYESLSSDDIRQLWRDVAQLKTRMQHIMEEYPLLIYPTNASHAFDLDDAQAQQECEWATLYLAPMLGLPAISVPAGFTDDAMPFGMMITGRAGEDVAVLQLAAAFESQTINTPKPV